MSTARFRMFNFGPNGTPLALVELLANPDIATRMSRSHFGRALALAASEVHGLPDAQLRGQALALGLLYKGVPNPGAKLKTAIGLPARVAKVAVFAEVAGRDAIALAVAMLAEQTAPELQQRVHNGRWALSDETMVLLVGKRASRNTVASWRRTPEYRKMVAAAAERVVESCLALARPNAHHARTIAAAVPREAVLSLVGGGPVPQLVLEDGCQS